jgi:hypothetical protein
MQLARPQPAPVDELSREQFAELVGQVAARIVREGLTPLVVAPPAAPEGLWSTARAARFLDCSPDELRDRVRRGEIVAVQDRPNGRYHFEPAELERYRQRHRTRSVAAGLDLRYSAAHDSLPRQGIAAPTRLDAAPARRRAQRDGDDGRPLGARRAHRQPAGRDEPYAPGAAAWSGPAPPVSKG